MRTVLLLLLAAAVALPGCAFMEKRNRPLTTTLDELVEPESTGAKVALAPVFVPVGTASLVLDVFALHPVEVIPDALDDTYEIIWENPSGTYVTQTFLLAPKLLVTPVVFGFDWLGRSIFDF
jgi:hypothetical protein